MPLRIFRSRSLIGGNLVLLTAGMCVDGTLVMPPSTPRTCSGTRPSSSRLLTAVLTVMSVVGAYTAQGVVGKVGPRPVAVP